MDADEEGVRREQRGTWEQSSRLRKGQDRLRESGDRAGGRGPELGGLERRELAGPRPADGRNTYPDTRGGGRALGGPEGRG